MFLENIATMVPVRGYLFYWVGPHDLGPMGAKFGGGATMGPREEFMTASYQISFCLRRGHSLLS